MKGCVQVDMTIDNATPLDSIRDIQGIKTEAKKWDCSARVVGEPENPQEYNSRFEFSGRRDDVKGLLGTWFWSAEEVDLIMLGWKEDEPC